MSDDDFLSRWSRRKRAVKVEAEEDASRPAPVDDKEPGSDEEEQALLASLNLPVPETLKAGDDFSAFMADGVPQFLRRRALRVLWRSNPVLANLDGLNDYDQDYTAPELTQRVLATAYQVGRGIVSQVSQDEPVESEREAESGILAEAPADTARVEISTENQPTVNTVVHNEEDAAEPEPAPRPRRMRFET